MPYRIWRWSKEEPARAILFIISALTGVAQTAATVIHPGTVGNLVLIMPICLWACVSCYRNNLKFMSWASFWLCLIWMWSGLVTLILRNEMWSTFLWTPFLIIAAALAVVYVHLSAIRRLTGE